MHAINQLQQQQQFGNYRLLHVLDSGGFADVYLAEHIYLKTPHAVKVLQIHLFDEEQQQRFLEEARIIARLDHPHIIQVVDFGVADATPFLVMSYAPHGNLRQLHPEGSRVPLATVVRYVKQVAGALQYAHEQHLIHRDIKPENLLLSEQDELLLSDFGIAIVAHSSHSQSLQDVVGTANYMPPEQLRGRPRPASDQYALAVLAYEWLCGALPFDGGTYLDIARQHLSAPVPSLAEKLPEISPAIAAVIHRALAKDTHQRFESIQAFADALEQAHLLNAMPAPAPAIEAPEEEHASASDLRTEQPREGQRHSRRLVLAALSGLGALAIGGSYLGWRTFAGTRAPSQGPSPKQITPFAPPSSTIGKTVYIYTGLSNTNKSNFEINTLAWSHDGTRILSGGNTKDYALPNFGMLTEWHTFNGEKILSSTVSNDPYTNTTTGDSTNMYDASAVWSPDGTRFAEMVSFYETRWSIATAVQIIDASTGQPLTVIQLSGPLAWSPDGKSLAMLSIYADPHNLPPAYLAKTPRMLLIDASTGLVTHASPYVENIRSSSSVVAWSPDIRYIASYTETLNIASSTDGVNVWEAVSARHISYYAGNGAHPSPSALVWSPDGQLLASGWGSEVHISSALTGAHVLTYAGHSQAVKAITWSPDGSRLATGGDDATVHIWDAKTGKLLYTYRQHTASIVALDWSPDGGYLASGSALADGTVHIWTAK